MFLILFLICVAGEIFRFDRPEANRTIMFRLDEKNINSGYFKIMEGGSMGFNVEIKANKGDKIFYKVALTEVDKESHFSFSNLDVTDASLYINAASNSLVKAPSSTALQMKFESTPDTFNQEVAKEKQIEPAIYALEQLLKKVNSVTLLSRSVIKSLGDLESANQSMLRFVFGLSFSGLLVYAILNVAQLYYMKAYLNEKKFL